MLFQSSAKVTQLQQAAFDFDPPTEIGADFIDFLVPLHKHFTPRQQELAIKRQSRLADAHRDRLPDFLPPSPATTTEWKRELPEWCRDQRNQMTGPADDAELVVKMLNSGAPGELLDLEDSTPIGYMEDLATDRIYRLMIAQRVLHRDQVKILDEDGKVVRHSPEFISALFDSELENLLESVTPGSMNEEKLRQARRIGEELIRRNEFNPS